MKKIHKVKTLKHHVFEKKNFMFTTYVKTSYTDVCQCVLYEHEYACKYCET